MVLVYLDVSIQKNENRSISILMHKTQVRMDQGPQYKFNYTKPDGKESGKYSSMHGHKRPLPKYNPSSTDTERNKK